mgnify:FL=1
MPDSGGPGFCVQRSNQRAPSPSPTVSAVPIGTVSVCLEMVEATPSPDIDREPDESSVRVVPVAIPPSSPRRHRVSGARLDAQAEKSQTPATAILNFFGRGAPTPDPFATIAPRACLTRTPSLLSIDR